MIRLNDEQLLGELAALCRCERVTTLKILRYLAEVEGRKLHLALGYASMFAFATRHLRYSESAAGRRVQASRCLRAHPELAPMLQRGSLTLSTLARIAPVLNENNKVDVLARVENASQRDVEAIVATYKPAARVRDRVHAVRIGDPAPAPTTSTERVGLFSAQPATRPGRRREPDKRPDRSRSGSAPSGSGLERPRAVDDSVPTEGEHTQPQFKVQFAARAEFMRKFEEARTLLSGRHPRGASFEAVFEAALDAFLRRKSPFQRQTRRRKTQRRKRARTQADITGTRVRSTTAARPAERDKRRAIPAAVRDRVYERDGGRCTFVGVEGERCDGRHDLEIDHRCPVARGGTNAIENLRLLCAAHNRFEAERVLGTAWMQRFT